MGKTKIENIVASAILAEKLDLNTIAAMSDDAEYNPEHFPGLIYRIKEPKTALLLFSSGKAVCTGGKSIEDVRASIGIVVGMLRKGGIPVNENPKIVIQNMVAVFDLGGELNLNAVAISVGLERVEYEPEQFPGLVYRLVDPKVVALIFGSGKVVLTGAKRIKDVGRAVSKLRNELKESGLLH
jgi:transcription initiation factor TFIID TATA-box-binding protein